MDPTINIAIAGVGNCASSLVQGIAHYQNGGANEQIGLMHWDLGGYRPKDLKVVAAWDVDARKVGNLYRAARAFTRSDDATRLGVGGLNARVDLVVVDLRGAKPAIRHLPRLEPI